MGIRNVFGAVDKNATPNCVLAVKHAAKSPDSFLLIETSRVFFDSPLHQRGSTILISAWGSISRNEMVWCRHQPRLSGLKLVRLR